MIRPYRKQMLTPIYRSQEDPMKPTLDRMVKMIVGALSGEAKDFYQREFAFFDEVTSISAKLKPFIKSSKPEKKVRCVAFAVKRASLTLPPPLAGQDRRGDGQDQGRPGCLPPQQPRWSTR